MKILVTGGAGFMEVAASTRVMKEPLAKTKRKLLKTIKEVMEC